MSRVTSAILMISEYGGVDGGDIMEPCFAENQRFVKTEESWDDNLGGYKHIEFDVYAAGFNYVDGDSLEQWFKHLPWRDGSAILVWEENLVKRGSISINWPARFINSV